MFNSNSIYGLKFKRQNKGQSYGEICEILRDGHMGHFKVSLIKNTACIWVNEHIGVGVYDHIIPKGVPTGWCQF